MNDRWLHSFVTVAQCGSFQKAAEKLLLTPQALWQQVRRLEGDVGFSLLSRTPKGVELTKAGEHFLRMAADVLERYDTTLAECRALLESQLLEPVPLRVPMSGGITLSPFWQRMYQERPRQRPGEAERPLCLEFVTGGYAGAGLIPGLLDGTFDLVEHHSIAGEHPDSVYYEELGRDESSIVVGADDPLASLAAARIEDLRGRELSAFTPAFSADLARQLGSSGEAIAIRQIPCDQFGIILACAKGQVCLVESRIELPRETLVKIPLDFDPNLRRGFACKKGDASRLARVFELAHRVSEELGMG